MIDNEEKDNKVEPAPEKRHMVFDTWIGKWLIHRMPAAVAWYWFILRFLNRPFPFGLQLSREYLLILPLVAWLIIVLFGRWLRFVLYPLYIFFFPILVAWFAFRLMAKIIGIPVQATRFARSGRLVFLLLVIVISGWSVTLAVDNSHTRAIASISAHTAIYVLFLQSFRWAANPYRPIIRFFGFVSDKGNAFIKGVFIEPAIETEGQSREVALNVCNWILKAVDFLYPDEAPLEKGITGFTRSHLVPVSIFGFVLLYAVLASSFSLSLYEIERAWGPQIIGLADSPSIAHYFYFSFLSQATAVPDNIAPVSLFGQVWMVWIVMTGMLLLTVLIAMFTTSVGIHGEDALSNVKDALELERKRFLEWKELLSQNEVETGSVIDGEFRQLDSGNDDG